MRIACLLPHNVLEVINYLLAGEGRNILGDQPRPHDGGDEQGGDQEREDAEQDVENLGAIEQRHEDGQHAQHQRNSGKGRFCTVCRGWILAGKRNASFLFNLGVLKFLICLTVGYWCDKIRLSLVWK